MRTLLSVIVLLLPVAAALGQPARHIVSGAQFDAPLPPSPTSIAWQLATADGQFVEMSFSGVHERPLPLSTSFVMTPELPLGVDFLAWQAAANDPAYNRSIMRLGSLERETPFLHDFHGGFHIDRITLTLYEYSLSLMPSGRATLVATLTNYLPVPEPTGSGWVVACAIYIYVVCGRRWSRAPAAR
jgi:hypothetical protein